jgi:glycosyltransferase involved in cell wall biosynthesis
MKVAMIAPVWLPIPPAGYGGVENMLAVLIPALIDLGVTVELFTIGASKLVAHKKHYLYEEAQYPAIHDRMYDALPIPLAHTLFSLNTIRAAGNFDLIHSHGPFLDILPAVYATDLPPIIHTLHGPPFTAATATNSDTAANNHLFWHEIAKAHPRNVSFVGISHALLQHAPKELRQLLAEPVHNGIDLKRFQFRTKKDDYFLILARVCHEKGQAIAARICKKLNYKLRIAGIIGSLTTPEAIARVIADSTDCLNQTTDIQYYKTNVLPFIDKNITYIGDVQADAKQDLLSHAKALLAPIQWEEPFGMTVIEALASGTPVIAMSRGALPEIIKHGINGFLAKTEGEFAQYMQHISDIDPQACRQSVKDSFSAQRMAQTYLQRYTALLGKSVG